MSKNIKGLLGPGSLYEILLALQDILIVVGNIDQRHG